MPKCREIDLGEGRHLRVLEGDSFVDPANGKSLTGAWVWDASIVMAMWFTTSSWPPGSFKNKRVVELGSGTSVPGMALATLGAHVVLTDRKPLMAGIEANIDANGLRHCARAAELQWGADRMQLDGILQCFRQIEAEAQVVEGLGRLEGGGGGEGEGKEGGDGSGERETHAEKNAPGANGEAAGPGRNESGGAGSSCDREGTAEHQGRNAGAAGSEVTQASTVTTEDTVTGRDTLTGGPTGPATSHRGSEGEEARAQSQEKPAQAQEQSQEPPEENPYAVDYVIGSDIMFDPESETMVNLSTAIKWLTGPRTRIFMCCELRPPLPECFRHMHDSGLRWRAVAQDQLHPDWSSEDIKIFEFFVGGGDVDES